METIYLPKTLTEIGNYAFSEAIRLKEVTIPSDVIKIGEYAFDGCLSLSNIMLPKSLIEVDKNAFNNRRDFHMYYEGTRDLFYKIDRNGELNMQDFYSHFESKGIEHKNVIPKFDPLIFVSSLLLLFEYLGRSAKFSVTCLECPMLHIWSRHNYDTAIV